MSAVENLKPLKKPQLIGVPLELSIDECPLAEQSFRPSPPLLIRVKGYDGYYTGTYSHALQCFRIDNMHDRSLIVTEWWYLPEKGTGKMPPLHHNETI